MIRAIEELFERQVRVWPQLARGIEGLAQASTRQLSVGWFDVFVRHISHRVASTMARVDPLSVASRPCFLCAANLPSEEEGIPFSPDFTIYCNPFPIVERHLTITHREHRPQRIANHLRQMFELAAALPGYFIIYNGPECGASAPDHMHFQAGARRRLPIERDTAGLTSMAVPDYGRNVLVLRGRDQSKMVQRISGALTLLESATAKGPEPLVNLAAFYEQGEWVVYLFPRAKHRPKVFYTGELTVSPATIDLCGIFVVPLAEDFAKITAGMVSEVFREVTLPNDQFQTVAAKLESEY